MDLIHCQEIGGKTQLLNIATNIFFIVMKIPPSVALFLLERGLSTFLTDMNGAKTAVKLVLEARFSHFFLLQTVYSVYSKRY